MTRRVYVLGDLAVDYYLRLPPHSPVPGGTADEKITAEQAIRLPGGTGGNAAAAACVLGSKVSLYSAVGDDPQGRWLADAAAARGIAIDGIQVFPGTSTQSTILLSGDSRQVIVDRGVADYLNTLTPPLTSAADIVYLTGSSAAIKRMAATGLAGYIIAGIECGMADDPGLADALRGVNLVITNAAGWGSFAERLQPELTVIETRGACGVVIHRPDGIERVPAVAVETVDATGAGDCFAGALCNYLAAGRDLSAAGRLAVTAAALSTQALGAQSALPTDAEVHAVTRMDDSLPRSEEMK
jgi:sugar/nucleoside kinase (ribokinase family)